MINIMNPKPKVGRRERLELEVGGDGVGKRGKLSEDRGEGGRGKTEREVEREHRRQTAGGRRKNQ